LIGFFSGVYISWIGLIKKSTAIFILHFFDHNVQQPHIVVVVFPVTINRASYKTIICNQKRSYFV